MRIDQSTDGNWHPLYCMDCRNTVTFHNGEVVASEPGKAPIPLGVEIACNNKNCGKVYIIEGFSMRQ